LLLQHKCELHEACFSLEITRNSVHIIYDETIIKDNYKQVTAIKDRVLALDLNPNYIGLVVLNKNTVLHKEIIDLTDLNKNSTTNKKKHWILETSKHVAEIAKHFRANIAIENLNIKSKDHKKGRKFNRLVNNIWLRNAFINNLKKRANILNIKCLEIYCAYSSFVGQMLNYTEYDSIAAAIEIGNRAIQALNKRKYEVLPKRLDLSQLPNQWKEVVVANGIKSWLEFYTFVKNLKSSYRVLFSRDTYTGVSFDLLTCNSCIKIHKIT
jgi:IS605 OrfB family transposase